MNTIGNNITLPVLPAEPKVSVPVRRAELPRVPERPAAVRSDVSDTTALTARAEVVVRTNAQPIADPRVLGTEISVTYRDAQGQAITRTRDRETGRITYFPKQEEVLRRGLDMKV